MKIRILCSIFAALMHAGAVEAQQIVAHITSITPVLTASPNSVTRLLHLPGFDPDLGTLTGVELTFAGLVTQSAKGENFGQGISPFSYSVSSTLTVSRTGGPNLFAFGPVTLAGAGVTQSFDGSLDFAGPSSFNSTLINTPASGVYNVPSLLLASYISSGLLDFTAIATGNSTVSGSGNLITETTNRVSGSLKVEYEYVQIPEPSTYVSLIGLTVFIIVTIRRRHS